MPYLSTSYDSVLPFHGGNTGSDAVGDAKILKDCSQMLKRETVERGLIFPPSPGSNPTRLFVSNRILVL